jgi:hypothetical protein
MNDSLYGELRAVNRKHYYELWKKAQEGDLEGVHPEKLRVLAAMKEAQPIDSYCVFIPLICVVCPLIIFVSCHGFPSNHSGWFNISKVYKKINLHLLFCFLLIPP